MRVTPDKTIDEEFELLGTEGYTGSINDRIMSYLGDLGRTGAISDRFGATEDELLNIELGNLFSKPKCADGDGWTDQSSVSTNLTDDALDYFPGVSVASGGGIANRLLDSQTINLTSGTEYQVKVFCKEGTSGAIRIQLRNDSGATNSILAGDFGSVVSTSTAAGTFSNITETALSGLTLIQFNFTPNASYELQFGIGPSSNVTGETVVAYGVHMEEAS